jgi:hypothetical protein
MADLQPDAVEELAWDLRALEGALEVDDERLMSARMIGTAEGMLPSLHLDLADVYLRLGDLDRAGAHVRSGRESLPALLDDGYRDMINGAFERLTHAIAMDHGI